jgi:hypothetical protein
MNSGRRRAFLQFGGTLAAALSIVAATALPAQAMTLSPSSGPPGTKVNIKGKPYDSSSNTNCKTVDVYWDGHEDNNGKVMGTKVQSAPCDASGNYSVDFNVPNGAAKGAHNVVVESLGGGDNEEQQFTVT